MKVLIICTEKLPVPPILGGAIQTYIAGSVPILSKNHDITILGITDPSLPDRETVDGIDYVRVPGKLVEIYLEGVVDYLKDQSFDLIHIFNRPRLVTPVREAAPTTRLVLSMHNDMFKREKIEPEKAKNAIRQLDKIITISDYIGKAMVELYPEAAPKLQTIYSGVDLDRFVPAYTEKGERIREAVRKEHGLEGKQVILFAGRLSANKGADVLVRAIPLLEKKYSNLALVLVGSKWFSQNDITDYIAYVRALAERLKTPVITTGFVSPTEIQKWFIAADIFVCPSQWQEPLARVHYEAMAAGLPIVTTARGGNAEVIEVDKNGFVIENPEDPQEFADYLSKLLSSPSLRNNLGKYGRKLAEEKYSWKRVVNDISSVWDEIEQNIKNNIQIGTDHLAEVEHEIISEEVPVAVGEISKLIDQLVLENETVDINDTEKQDIKDSEEVDIGDTEKQDIADSEEVDVDGTEEQDIADSEEVDVDGTEEQEEEEPKKRIFVCENNPPARPWLSTEIMKREKNSRKQIA